MVIYNHDNNDQEDIEITTDDNGLHDPELEDVELTDKNIISRLKAKLKASEAEKRDILEATQRSKADFLNARKRLEEERKRDKERLVVTHVEELIPLCDSFEVAMTNTAVWQKVDETWRKGVEGIYAQLRNIIQSYHVEALDPVGVAFSPHEHDAIGTVPVTDAAKHDTIITVAQKGYQIRRADNTTEIIRPARVVIGLFE